MNSTWAASWKYQFGRYTGQEGYFDTDVIAANQLPVVAPATIAASVRDRILTAYRELVRRPIGPIRITEKVAPNGRRTRIGDDELQQSDRRRLDEAIAEAFGVDAEMVSTEVDVLYADLGEQFDATRAKELRALEGKSSGMRKLTNEGVADAILASFGDQYRSDPHRFPS